LKKVKDSYLSKTGRPIDWFYSDPTNKIKSAYFACSNCGHPISNQQRLAAKFKCLKTGFHFTDFQAKLPTTHEEVYKQLDTVTIHLSPLLRDSKYNLAAYLIDIGLNTESTRDYQQQVLGFASSHKDAKITRDMVLRSNQAKTPPRSHDFVICGIDQGRDEDYICIARYWLNENKELPTVQRIEESYRQIILCKPILRDNIIDTLNQYNVIYGFIDNEPDRSDAYLLSKQTVLEPADQKETVKTLIRPIIVSTGGIEINAFEIDNTFFCDSVLNTFSQGTITTNADDFDVTDKGVHSPFRHFSMPYKDDEDKWQRAKDKIDDLFFAFVFCEAAFYQLAKQKFDDEFKPNIDWYGSL
jgi:hypothetical protein